MLCSTEGTKNHNVYTRRVAAIKPKGYLFSRLCQARAHSSTTLEQLVDVGLANEARVLPQSWKSYFMAIPQNVVAVADA